MTLKNTLAFFSDLKDNNHRDWFNAHKDAYQTSKEEFEVFVTALMERMKAHDHIDEANTKIYRIYKDVRFSKDKTPYKTSWSTNIKRATKLLRGGYYLQVGPGNSYMAGGFFGPNPQDLLHIRKHISQDATDLRAALAHKELTEFFGDLRGEQVKSAPKGFSKEDENIHLLRYKQFMLRHNFSDQEVAGGDFIALVDRGFQLMRPFFDVMTEILTTDLDGQPLT